MIRLLPRRALPLCAFGLLLAAGEARAGGPIAASRTLAIPTASVAPAKDTPAGPIITILPVRLEVALVEDPDFPPLDAALVDLALERAAATFAERFNVNPPKMRVLDRMDSTTFLERYVDDRNPRCKKNARR